MKERTSRFGDSYADGLALADKAAKPEKPFGHEVTVMFRDGTLKTFHYVGGRAKARMNGIMKPLASQIVSIEPVTKEQWFRAYGNPSERGL